jgi:cytochrome c2
VEFSKQSTFYKETAMKYPHLKKTEAVSLRRGISLVAVFGLLLSLVAHPGTSEAAQLTNARDYLSRQQASVTTGIQHEVFLKPATSVSGGAATNKVILVFPDGDDGLWCRTAGSLTVTPITNPTGATETSGTLLPGTPTGACTQGSGGSSFDTFTISAVDNMSAGTNYGVRFVGVVGRKRAAVPGFAYSDAMKAKGGNWDYESLNQYLTKPKDFIPGNKMAFPGLKKAQDRANVVKYLESASKK